MATEIIWTEKYRPSSIEELSVPDRVKSAVKSGATQNMLFYGGPGMGKTSAARISADGCAVLFVNCSLHTGVDEVRSRIVDFCQVASVIDDVDAKKVVVLDELDGVSDQYFKALRGVVEQFHSTTRFIATTNYFNKIPDAIKSRFECVCFDPLPGEEVELKRSHLKRAYHILKEEGMSFDKDALVALVERSFPDFRRVVSVCQIAKASGASSIDADSLRRASAKSSELFDLVLSPPDPVSNYKNLSKYSSSVDEVISTLGRDLIEYIMEQRPEKASAIGPISYEVSRHAADARLAIDPFVTLLSLAFRIQTVSNK